MSALRLGLAVLLAAAIAPAQTTGLFSLIRDEARTHKLEEAKRHLAARERAAAIELLLETLRCSPSAVSPRPGGGYTGLREAARAELARLPVEAIADYERLIGGEAEARLREARLARDPEQLSDVAARYPASRHGASARLVAGDLFLEEGRLLRALREFSFLAGDAPEVLGRRTLCRALLGLPAVRPPAGGWPAELPFGGSRLAAETWRQRVEALRGRGLPAGVWPAYGGGLDGSRLAEEPIDPRQMMWRHGLEHLEQDGPYDFSLGVHGVADGRRVYVNTGTKVYALDILSGPDSPLSWESPSHIHDIDDRYERLQFVESISPHFVHSAALGNGLVVAPLQVPIIPDVARDNHDFNGIPILRRLPVRRLHAFEAETGRLRWAHWERDRPLFGSLGEAPLDVSGPPLVVDDTVYVLTHRQQGTIALYLMAFDLATGAPRFRTLICSSQIEVNMFGNQQQEFAAGALVYSDGVVYASTNLGLVVAARADDGSILWLHDYPIIEIPPGRMRVDFRTLHWANNAPVLADGVLLVTPIDSEDALALDAASGQLLWRLPHEVGDGVHRHQRYELRWLVGSSDGLAWFAGQCLAGVPVRGRGQIQVLASPQALGMSFDGDSSRSIPRPLLASAGDRPRIWFLSTNGGLVSLDGQGRRIEDTALPRSTEEVGNLISSGGVLLSVRPGFVHAYYRVETLLTAARNAKSRQPEAPEAALAYAELLAARPDRGAADLQACIEEYRHVLRLCERTGRGPGSPIAMRAKLGLFRKLRALAATQEITQPRPAKQHYVEAMALGREGWRAGFIAEKDLVRFYVGLLDRYEKLQDGEMTERLLGRLETDHAAAEYAFAGAQPVSVGLFATMARLRTLSGQPARRLELLQRLLVEHGDAVLPLSEAGETCRSFATRAIAELIEKHGRAIYAPLEREAAELLARASGSPSQLRLVLDRYPSSTSAERALLELGNVARRERDLATAIDMLAMAIQRLPKVPPELLAATAETAAAAGNQPLADTILARLAGRPALGSPAPLLQPDRLRGAPTVRRQHVPGLGTQRFREPLRAGRVAGFASTQLELPLLLLGHADQLFAFKPRTDPKGPRYRLEDEDYQLAYRPPIHPVEPAIYGDRLVLPEEASVHAVDLREGGFLWSYQPPAEAVRQPGEERVLLRAGPLATGLYLACFGTRTPIGRRTVLLVGIEPSTGVQVFARTLPVDQPPVLANGRVFRFEAQAESRIPTIVVTDLLTGDDAFVVPLDGKVAPRLERRDASSVLVLSDRLLLRAVNGDSDATDPGLYCLDLDSPRPTLRWRCRAPALTESDTFVVSGDEVLLTLGFGSPRSTLWRVDLDKGTRRREVGCGAEARLLGAGAQGPAQTAPGPHVVVAAGESHTRILVLDTRPGSISFSHDLGRSQLGVEDDIPPPSASERVLALPMVTGRRVGQTLTVLLFDLEKGDPLPAAELRQLPWDAEGSLQAWNGDLVLRSRRNDWVFSATMQSGGAEASK